ncbi:MAG: TauD/TfdA family dioxygenase [Acidobacteriota bacterium]
MKVRSIPTADCQSYDDYLRQRETVRRLLETRGYVLIQAWDAELETLEAIAGVLGVTQYHVRAGERGVVGEGEARFGSWRSHGGEYQGTTEESFPPHTDGSFLLGLFPENGVMRSVRPPKLILLQCVQAAAEGGTNTLVDGQEVVSSLLEREPEMLRTLMSAGCVAFCRDDQLAVGGPVYSQRRPGALGMRFRFDRATYVAPWAYQAVERLHVGYHQNAEYTQRVHLAPGQILIVDNLRVLHGRDAFRCGDGSVRKYRRIWIADEGEEFLSPLSREEVPRALEPYRAYERLLRPPNPDAMELQLGIKLEPHQERLLESLTSSRDSTHGAALATH